MNLNNALQAIADNTNIKYIPMASVVCDDEIGGYHSDPGQQKWGIGSIWGVEGQILAALVYATKPQVIVNLGVFEGCSITHIMMGVQWAIELRPDYAPTVIAVDRYEPPCPLPEGVEFVQMNAIDYAETRMPDGVGLLFEDLDHGIESVSTIWREFRQKAAPGGVIVSHDAMHHIAGADVRLGIIASGIFDPLLLEIEPSDCGLAIWQAPPANADLNAMTVDELKTLAEVNGVDLAGLRRKSDIIEAIEHAS